MTKAPKLQPRSVSTKLDTIFAGIEKLTVLRGRGNLGKVWPHVGHPSGVGVEDAGVVNSPVDFLLKPGILAIAQLTQVFLKFKDPGELKSLGSADLFKHRVIDLGSA